MDKTRAFTIDRPWYSILAAGHVPEVFNATCRDAFGLRGRLTICVPHPKFQTLEEVVAACNELCVPSHTPADFLAALLYPVLEDSLKHAEGDMLMFLPCVDFAFGFFCCRSMFSQGRDFKPHPDDGAFAAVQQNFDAACSQMKRVCGGRLLVSH